MKPGAIIHRYIFKELLSPFIISLAFFMFMFLMTELVDITDKVINYGVGFTTVLIMLGYTMPYFLQFVIPMATMIGVLLAFLKMSSDNEIIALKASGMSIWAMLPPVIVFCLLGCIITMVMTVYGEPWSRASENVIKRKLNANYITSLLKESKFSSISSDSVNLMIYISKIDSTLSDVFIEESYTSDQGATTHFSITAPRGRIAGDPDSQVYQLQLEQGQINRIDIETKAVSATDFDALYQQIDLKQAMKSSGNQKKVKEMQLGELRKYIRSREKKDKSYYEALIAFHNKFALPFACFALGILAVPLGIQSKSAKRSFGIGLGVFFLLGYYLIMSAGDVYGRDGHCPPVIGMWAPNIVMGGIGCFLLVRCARERNTGIGWLFHLLHRKSHSDADSKENPSASITP